MDHPHPLATAASTLRSPPVPAHRMFGFVLLLLFIAGLSVAFAANARAGTAWVVQRNPLGFKAIRGSFRTVSPAIGTYTKNSSAAHIYLFNPSLTTCHVEVGWTKGVSLDYDDDPGDVDYPVYYWAKDGTNCDYFENEFTWGYPSVGSTHMYKIVRAAGTQGGSVYWDIYINGMSTPQCNNVRCDGLWDCTAEAGGGSCANEYAEREHQCSR